MANILQMGNIANTYFTQYDWKPISTGRSGSYVLVAGQEDPRTSHLGHTIQLNIKEPFRNPPHYLLYREAFEHTHAQGGLTGYAHVAAWAEASSNVAAGMAIDAPFGLVDFAEVFSGSAADGSTWFDFLNLGYKIAPSAGTDYPYGDVPGGVRSYVKLSQAFTPQRWFDGLENGHTFVTSGPMLEFSVNGAQMGSELHLKEGDSMKITAKASLNPDLDRLSSLQLIEQGEVLETVTSEEGAPEMELHYDIRAKHGTWYVLRALGKQDSVAALSAPIYIFVGQQTFWKPAAVPSIVAKLKPKMQSLLGPMRVKDNTEEWDTREVDARYWADQQSALEERINRATAVYDDLVRRAATAVAERVRK